MTDISNSHELLRAVCAAIGEDPSKVGGIHIDLKIDDVPRVTVARFLDITDSAAVAEVVKAFKDVRPVVVVTGVQYLASGAYALGARIA